MNPNVILPSNPELILKLTTKNTQNTKHSLFTKLEQDRNGLQPECIPKWNNIFNNELHVWEDILLRPFTAAETPNCILFIESLV